MPNIEPYAGEPDKNRLIAVMQGKKIDRVPNFEILIEDRHVAELLGREAGNTMAVKRDPAGSGDRPEDFRPMHPNDYIELCRLIGQDALAIEKLWDQMFRLNRHSRRGHYMMAISAVDNALWDLRGRYYNAPVYRLLGGPCRDKVWMYPSPKAIKIGPGGAKPFAGTPAEIEDLVQRVHKAREKVGPDGAVMFDAHSCLPPPIVKQFASYLKPDDLLFLEEAWVHTIAGIWETDFGTL